MDTVRREHIKGLSVTIPHKQSIMPLLDRVSSRARAVGAVNTVFWDNGQLKGTNTDLTGCLTPLRGLGRVPRSALVLGAGGAARAVIAAVHELGVVDVAVTNRHRDKAEALARDFSVRVVDWENRHVHPPELLVNTTPLGMAGKYENLSPWPLQALPQGTVVFDLIYNPLRTNLVNMADGCGCTIISGLEMFLYQGLKQFKLWTGKDLDPAQARCLLLEHLAPGGGSGAASS